MKAPEEIELNTCTFSDIGLFDIDEEEVTYIRKDALWKPGEEQMEALEYVIRDYIEDGCNATANYLQEILNHLKNM